MKQYRLKQEIKTFAVGSKVYTVTNKQTYSEDNIIVKNFKKYFYEDGKQILNEQPIEQAKVQVIMSSDDDKSLIDVDVTNMPIETKEENKTVDYNSLETKEELEQYVADNNIEVNFGNVKNVDKLKARIAEVLGK